MFMSKINEHSYKGFVITPHISIDANVKGNLACRKETVDRIKTRTMTTNPILKMHLAQP